MSTTMMSYEIKDEKLKDPNFLQNVRNGMTNGWSANKMAEMGVKSNSKHAYFMKLQTGGFMVYGAQDEIILNTTRNNFENGYSEVMEYMQKVHKELCTTWVSSHILTLEKKLNKEVDSFLEARKKTRCSVNSATLEAIYNRIELKGVKDSDYALLKVKKTDNTPRVAVAKSLGLLVNPDLSGVCDEAKERILALLKEL